MTKDFASWSGSVPASIKVEQRGEIALVTLNRPEKRNALSDEVVLGLTALFAAVPKDVKGIVLSGTGGNFTAGLDLNELKEASVVESFETSEIGQRLNDTVQYCKVPVIAVLNGACIGGGLELAAACHVRIAEVGTYYALPEGVRGIFVGSGGSVRLTRLIGASTVMEMMLSGRVYTAEEGYQLLRVTHYLVQPGEGLEKGVELAQKIAKNAPLANFAILQGIPRIIEQDPQAGLFTEMLLVGVAQGDEEAKGRLRNFLDKKMDKVARR